MSFADRVVLWLHIAFAIFTIGPVTMAIMSTPRYIRKRNSQIVRYLARLTVIYAIACLGVLIAGLFLAELDKDFSHPWLTVSMTLFVVALFLLVLVIRDQRRAITSLESAAASAPAADLAAASAELEDQRAVLGPDAQPEQGPQAQDAAAAGAQPGAAAAATQVAAMEHGRIAMIGGVVSLIWLVILVLMVWQP
jgi:Ca2+/Na+ antiporter